MKVQNDLVNPENFGGLPKESGAVSPLGVISLLRAFQFAENGASLSANGKEAKDWVDYYHRNKDQIAILSKAIPKKQFDVCLTRIAQKVTEFIKDKGFNSVYGNDSVAGSEVYAAVYTRMIRQWENKLFGKPAAITYPNGQAVFASKFELGWNENAQAVAVNIGGRRAMIKNLETNSGDEFGLSVAIIDGPATLLASNELLSLGKEVLDVLKNPTKHFVGYNEKNGTFTDRNVIVPFMRLGLESNLDFLKKISIGSSRISKTDLQGRVICDHEGYASEIVSSAKTDRGTGEPGNVFHRPVFVLIADVDEISYIIEVIQMGQDSLVMPGINDQTYSSGDKEFYLKLVEQCKPKLSYYTED